MQASLLANGAAKVLIVAAAAVVVAGLVIWKVLAVARAARTKGSPEERQKAVGKALHGPGYEAGYDAGRRAGEKFVNWLKGKKKDGQ